MLIEFVNHASLIVSAGDVRLIFQTLGWKAGFSMMAGN